ncbi:hypothetical protein [Actinomycetospora succinea]|uniref:hypothetical protein n=1 Tax=Actinomycetospora succinea TaxID=663603 RepID=UPI00105D6C0B|nr:hypothetical protein [Actinomycetospora succinea]
MVDGVADEPLTATTAIEVMGELAAALEVLAGRWGCGLDVVHDLEGDVRAFAVIAWLEGFAESIPCHVPATRAAL